MTGLPNHNFTAFRKAHDELVDRGFIVFNPAMNFFPEAYPGGPVHHPTAVYLRRDIHMLLQCDAIGLLPGWRDSRGATMEWMIASMLDYDLNEIHLDPFALITLHTRY